MINPPYGLTRVKNKQKMLKDFTATEFITLEKNKWRLEKYFNENGFKIFSSIAKITERPIYSDTFHASFTTAGLMPYDINDNWFMVPAQKSIKKQMAVVIHELIHLQIIFYYMKYCLQKGLSRRQFSELNEIITPVLSQPMLRELHLPSNKEYPRHGKLVKQINSLWFKDKNIKNLLDKSIILVKKTPITE